MRLGYDKPQRFIDEVYKVMKESDSFDSIKINYIKFVLAKKSSVFRGVLILINIVQVRVFIVQIKCIQAYQRHVNDWL